MLATLEARRFAHYFQVCGSYLGGRDKCVVALLYDANVFVVDCQFEERNRIVFKKLRRNWSTGELRELVPAEGNVLL